MIEISIDRKCEDGMQLGEIHAWVIEYLTLDMTRNTQCMNQAIRLIDLEMMQVKAIDRYNEVKFSMRYGR